MRNYDLEVLRNEVSVVLQKNVLFSGTILQNLRWGNENATEEECKEACRLACADEFIDRFEDGYNTYIEQGGSNVSGGQKQRLCIARALLKNPKILILDDQQVQLILLQMQVFKNHLMNVSLIQLKLLSLNVFHQYKMQVVLLF